MPRRPTLLLTPQSISISGNISAANVSSSGQFLAADGTAALPSYSFTNDTNTGFYRSSSDLIGIVTGGAALAVFSTGSLQFASTASLQWSSTADPAAAGDTVFVRDASNVLAMKNATNPQAQRWYGTTTNSKFLQASHDGTDGNVTTSGGNLNLTPSTSLTRIVNGTTAQQLQISGTSTNNKYLQLTHDGTNGIITTSGGVFGFGVLTSSVGKVFSATDGITGYVTGVTAAGATIKFAIIT